MQKFLLSFLTLIIFNSNIKTSVEEVSYAIKNQDVVYIVKTLSKKSYTAAEKSEFLRLASEQVNKFQEKKIYNSKRAILRTLYGTLISTACGFAIYISVDGLNYVYSKHIDSGAPMSVKELTDKLIKVFKNVTNKIFFNSSINLGFGCLGMLFGLDQIKKGITVADDKESLEKARAIVSFLMKISI